jgi:topoisomerase-4 subunit B
MARTSVRYDESSVRILEGLEPVRLRPGMYTRTANPLHIVLEVVDNAVDEALAGFARTISVELLAHGGVRVTDDGRGIPVGLHPQKKVPVVQAVFTVLHAGGKFDKADGGAYSFSGGLHGVGVSVTNALSRELHVAVLRDGWRHEIGFAAGEVATPLKRVARASGTGTCVTVYPDPRYFDDAEIPARELRAALQSKAVLLPGLTVHLHDARTEPVRTETFRYDDGLTGYLAEQAGEAALTDIVHGQAYAQADDEHFADGEGVAWALAWYERDAAAGDSFVNLIPTAQGGTHVAGLRAALFAAVRSHIEHHGLLPKGLKLAADDVFRNVRYVVSARLLDPSFENQTKDRLASRDAVRLVERMLGPRLEDWLNLNPGQARIVAELALRNAAQRTRASARVERRRSVGVVMLPGKLADCESSNPADTELFLVEGDSAGGSAKMGRDKEFQAILPLRGKSLNVWERSAAEAMANEEIHDISVAVGVTPHGTADVVEFSRLRYGKVVVLADADVDGFHIQTLLLTLFFRHFPQLIARGHVYVARPPLYRLDAEAAGKKRPARKVYAMDDAELAAWQDRLGKEGYGRLRIGRFKGLGEMDPPELWDTTLNPDTRRLLQVRLPQDQTEAARQAFTHLMGKAHAEWRRAWMERRGDEVRAG